MATLKNYNGKYYHDLFDSRVGPKASASGARRSGSPPSKITPISSGLSNDQKLTGFGGGDVNSYGAEAGDVDQDGSSKGGSKKKGKKGKKVSPAVLGLNVVSNRIMMGEI
ncbi:uncharacterized protein Pyn_02629 [Prunus yedoensis var. nudiflora]|uniref:Uncharacterized protein n=1 Tax=Prunus yedoensis var. nudiflora TaxID=2094558 RepID=A0A314YU28_PRUYE|nr:uncharacterized protein Pyn_02629 [Prunus yedoensis var. nudiflora]